MSGRNHLVTAGPDAEPREPRRARGRAVGQLGATVSCGGKE
jgi:hypothetical protein